MEKGSPEKGITQAKGVRQLVGEGECLLDTLERLVGIAQEPQERSRFAPAAHSKVKPATPEGGGGVLGGFIRGYRLLWVLAPRHKLAPTWQGHSERIVRHQEERRVLYVLRQAEQLLPQLTRGQELPPYQ